jgi:asparagine synthase (glutamine-hydrolysing)
MCGIYIYLGQRFTAIKSEIFRGLKTLQPRGPDATDYQVYQNKVMFGFQRLAIIDPTPQGMQPLTDSKIHLVCNGEIYNYKELIQKYSLSPVCDSDCAVILSLYKYFGGGKAAIERICHEMDAEFCFSLYDEHLDEVFVARDFGIRPLFYALDEGECFFASEAKALPSHLEIKPFPPRSYWTSGSFVEYHPLVVKEISTNYLSMVKESLETSVIRRLHADRPIGFFLSGGLDSSLVVAIAAKHLQDKQPIHTFSIGLSPDSPDLVSARKVSSFLNTIHHEVLFTVEEAFQQMNNLIQTLETFDTTTIRASMPQYLLAKYVSQQTDIKVLLSGEGSDELAFGYLMFSLAPTPDEAQKVSLELLRDLYMYDCLRCDRSTACWGLEVRVPFLSWEMVDLLISIPPEEKQIKDGPYGKIEKYLIRKAFDGYLPDDILWRGKAAFSDAVGLGWVDYLKIKTAEMVSDEDFSTVKYQHCPPRTKEEFYYRRIYEQFYPNQKLLDTFWFHRWQETNDPSARFLHNYKEF